ncbi:MAG: CHRD domain-containing protein [Acidobacteriota bacterium]
MRRIVVYISTAALAVFCFGSFVHAKSKIAAGAAQSHTLKVALSGGAEVPGPGDTDGSGMAELTMNHDKGEMCYDITAKDIQTPTAAHIHIGAADKAGAVKIAFKKAADGTWKGCASADQATLNEIMKTPGNYYVNVHTAEFPAGAIRGQLGK